MADSARPSVDPLMHKILASVARLQEVVPDAVRVGGTAVGLYAHHRVSFDHDHVLTDLVSRYDTVLQAMEDTEGWVLAQRYSRPPVTIMGSLDGVEAGLRQLRRARPLEVEEVALGDGRTVTVPTFDEMLRIKAWLVLQRRSVRDYLDVAALIDAGSVDRATGALRGMDDFYDAGEPETVTVRLAEALISPSVSDPRVLDDLPRYRNLDRRWHDWSTVEALCRKVGARL